MTEYDVIVVGGGPGGYVAAATAAKNGRKTLLVEQRELGGTCLNRGCIPTKALLHCTGLYRAVRESENMGVRAEVRDFDYSAAFSHKEKTVQRLRLGVASLVKKSGCTVLAGEAVLRDGSTLQVGDEVFGFGDLILATGSIPAPFPFSVEGDANVVNSDGFLALDTIPQTVLVIGGGVIGLEFATILAEMGRTVTVVEATGRVLPTMDSELAATARKSLEKAGVRFFTDTFVQRITLQNGQTICATTAGEMEAELVVCAIGRIANTAGLHCERAGIAMRKSFVEVDDRCATTAPHIYAIGDVNGRWMLAHAASYQGRKVAENLVHGTNHSCMDVAVPGCVYTNPELASVGLTEDEANAQGIAIQVGRVQAVANGKLLSMGEKNGFVKLISDAATGEILGAQLATPHATDMIGEIALAMKLEGTRSEIFDTIHPHPTVCEMLMDAAG